MLAGKKTYIMAVLGALVSFAHLMGWIDRGIFEALMGILGFGAAAALRAGIEK
jgi:hypothetical protein